MVTLISLVIGVLLGWFRLHYNQLSLQDYAKYISGYSLPYDLLYPWEIGFMALGYVSLVLLVIKWPFLKHLWQGLAKTGQLALTNYLVQSIICVLFFTGFGMGYFGRLQQWQLYVFAADVALINVVFSVLWLRHFDYGPAEWLWRCLIYKKWFVNRRKNNDIETVTAVS